MRKLSCALSGLIVGALPLPAAAQGQQAPAQPASRQQTPPPGPGDDEGSDDIVVSGELRGAVPGDIKPEEQLTSGDIRAYGVNSISDLLAQLAPQTSSARGRGGEMPVVLLNGRRISGFSEIRDLPVEAIERVDILPEEAALKFGYRADQRVVNIVLRQRFRAITSELGASFPTAGGNSGKKVSADLLKIARDSRINVDVQYQSNSAILESERNVVPTLPGGTVDAAPYRTLVGPGSAATFTATYSRNLSSKTSMSINARLEQSQRESLLGLPALNLVVPAGNPFSSSATDTSLTLYPQPTALQRSSNNRTAHLGLTLNGDLKPWRWSVTGNYDRITSETITGTGFDPAPFQARLDAGDPAFNPFAPIAPTLLMMRAADRAHSVSSVGALDALLSGPLVKLPAGSATLSVRGTAGTSQFDSGSLRGGIARSGSVGRGRFDGQASLDIPLTSRREGVLGAIGDLGINGNVEVEHLSDFGTLTTLGYGAHWAPIPQLRFIASVTDEQGAPSAQQLGDPVVFTPGVRVFDFVTGQTVDITAITGGNPALGADKRHVFKLGLNARPFDKVDFNLNADYVRSTIRNQISTFPTATPELEGAFPGRFIRDANGRLLSIDQRPLNFQRGSSSQLHWGFNLSIPVASSLEERIRKARTDYEKARDDAASAGKPPPDPRPFFNGLTSRYGTGAPNLGNSVFGGPIFGGFTGGGRGQGGQGQRGQGAPGGQAAPAGQTGQPAQAGAQPGPPGTPGGAPGGGPGGGFRGGGGGGGFRGGGGGRGLGGANSALAGRIQVSFYHTWHFRDQVLIRDPLPPLDFLNGSAQGSSGGESRHELDLQAGYTKNGLGMRLTGHWQSATDVNGGSAGAANALHFGSLGTVGLRFFADMGQQIPLLRKHPWLLGLRIGLQVDNLFDAKLHVTNSSGMVPLGYQPDLLDPNGRTIRFSIRKLLL